MSNKRKQLKDVEDAPASKRSKSCTVLSLPNDVIISILQFLPVQQLCSKKICFLNKNIWHLLTTSVAIWYHKYISVEGKYAQLLPIASCVQGEMEGIIKMCHLFLQVRKLHIVHRKFCDSQLVRACFDKLAASKVELLELRVDGVISFDAARFYVDLEDECESFEQVISKCTSLDLQGVVAPYVQLQLDHLKRFDFYEGNFLCAGHALEELNIENTKYLESDFDISVWCTALKRLSVKNECRIRKGEYNIKIKSQKKKRKYEEDDDDDSEDDDNRDSEYYAASVDQLLRSIVPLSNSVLQHLTLHYACDPAKLQLALLEQHNISQLQRLELNCSMLRFRNTCTKQLLVHELVLVNYSEKHIAPLLTTHLPKFSKLTTLLPKSSW